MCGKVGWAGLLCPVGRIRNTTTPPPQFHHPRTHAHTPDPSERVREARLTQHPPGVPGRTTPEAPKGMHTHMHLSALGLICLRRTPAPQSPAPLPSALPLCKCTGLRAGRICFEISNRRVFPPFFHSQALSVAIRLEQGCQQMQEAPSRVQAFRPARPEGMDLRTHSRSWLNLFYSDGGSWGRNIISEMPKE